MKLRTLCVLAVGICLVICAPTQASPITYTFSFTGSGKLGAQTFSNAAILLTATDDTSSITNPSSGLFKVTDLTATINIAGIGTANFTDSMNVVANHAIVIGVNPPVSGAGFSDITNNRGVIFAIGTNLSSYDLSTPIGPLTDPRSVLPAGSTMYNTNDGALSFTAQSANDTFTASVPEPSSLGLLGVVGAVLLGMRPRRKLAAASR